MTLSLKRTLTVTLAIAGLVVFFFLAPVVQLNGVTSVPVSADSPVAVHCGWKSYNYTWTEFRSLGYHVFGFGYRYIKYDYENFCF